MLTVPKIQLPESKQKKIFFSIMQKNDCAYLLSEKAKGNIFFAGTVPENLLCDQEATNMKSLNKTVQSLLFAISIPKLLSKPLQATCIQQDEAVN